MGKIRYEITVEIFEGNCDSHKEGEKFKYPGDIGKICPWLLDCCNSMIRVLLFGGTLPWKYKGTPYEKEVDRENTTEFLRCPDPTSNGVVAKITCRKLDKPLDVGWA